MGGDFAPGETVRGAILATQEYNTVEVILVGNESKINNELKKYKNVRNISVINATEVISTSEPPVQAIKQKKDSSMVRAVALVKDGKADAVVSCGNTGALMASSLFGLGRVEGIERPAITSRFPSKKGKVVLLDMGANVDCKPKNLLQFAKMGSIYSEHVLGIKDPKVGLLNIGEEAEKGNELTTSTYPLLEASGLNFVGNVESKEIFDGKVDVVVCDGFIGNLILKFGESTVLFVFSLLKEEFSKHPFMRFLALLMIPAMNRLKKKVDYDAYGGAMLLGLNAVSIKAHGRASAEAIKNAIKVAHDAVEGKVVDLISKVGEI